MAIIIVIGYCRDLTIMIIKTIKTEQEKIELIQACAGDELTLLFLYDEDPGTLLEAGSVERIGENRYLVSTPYSFETLTPWLRFGNWQAVYPENADYGSFNTFKSSDKEIEDFMNAHSLVLLIDSFYDDTEWKVIWNMSS